MVLPDEMPNPIFRTDSAFSDCAGSPSTEVAYAVVGPRPAGTLDGAGSFDDDDASALAFLLLEKKDDDDCRGIFGVLELLDVIDPLRDIPGGTLGDLSSRSDCLARKPNVPLEAIVGADFAPHSN